MRILFIILTAAITLCLWPTTAQACVCVAGGGNLHTDLKVARERASAIYRARVVPAPRGPYLGTVDVEVLEVIKGPVVTGEKFNLPQGGGGDCRVRFRGEAEYLIYAEPKDARLIWHCSRSRPMTSLDDAEWVWLTTGKLPSLPAVVQRESVSCEPCDMERIGGSLITPPGKALIPPHEERKALALMKARRPFLTHSSAASTGQRLVMVGRSWEGKSFELIQTPAHAAEARCTQQVHLRWCKQLTVSKPYPDESPRFQCVEPETPELACDEAQSRQSKWEPLETLAADQCHWRTSSYARCTFNGPPVPHPEGVPTSPLLVCRPEAGRHPRYACSVQAASPPSQPE
ncbi:putative lipoprotein [Myxococcus xanthus DK 1622]|uniref:Lipoprotein n=1 Tax=Myxococcus xanthus (strain DK1622) TaxID=246197 RepID=Q1D1L4_MYXXD|nr:hypothetical protein [Myxococcus xanthus]ABF90034.1 putative lipoprotein [Myxococcus xanthus DK 1622]NOJ53693.1 hypothetical protein [Myxococcus xanthus]QPM77782.1 hypothetical protein I5Q59_26230 [Myxococcus xanthus]QVW66850.1 hypothetical protein JTM82_31580 [Myxococcus xanthus DZ2]QZZ52965.1 hypothetical protein MyxoNM_27500 [Myxococcus xanthus]